MLTCQLRFLELVEEGEETGPQEQQQPGSNTLTDSNETDSTSQPRQRSDEDNDEFKLSTDDQVKDYLLESLSGFGLVEELQTIKFSPKVANFSIRMARFSEALRAVERLNGSSLHLGRSLIAIVKAVYGGPKGTRIKVTYPTAVPAETQSQVLTTVRRRFAFCGTIVRADFDTPSSITITFEDIPSTLRAFEDFKERGGLSDAPVVEFADEEKKRHRVPSEVREETGGASTLVITRDVPVRATSPAEAAAKRSRDVAVASEGLMSSPAAESKPQTATQSLSVMALVHQKESKRSRDVPLESSSHLGANPVVVDHLESSANRSKPTVVRAIAQPKRSRENEDHDAEERFSKDMAVSTEAVERLAVSSHVSPIRSTSAAVGSATVPSPSSLMKGEGRGPSSTLAVPTPMEKSAADEGRQLFVVHAKNVQHEEVVALFQSRAGYEHIDIKRAKRAGLRGMAFVTFSTKEEAATAMEELHGKPFPEGSDQLLKVLFAQPVDASRRPEKRSSEAESSLGNADDEATATSSDQKRSIEVTTEAGSRKKPASSSLPSPSISDAQDPLPGGETNNSEDDDEPEREALPSGTSTTTRKKKTITLRTETPSPLAMSEHRESEIAIGISDSASEIGSNKSATSPVGNKRLSEHQTPTHPSASDASGQDPRRVRTQRSSSADRASMASSPTSFLSEYGYSSTSSPAYQPRIAYHHPPFHNHHHHHVPLPYPQQSQHQFHHPSSHQYSQPPAFISYHPMYASTVYSGIHESELAARTTDALAETFGNVMAFNDPYPTGHHHHTSEVFHPSQLVSARTFPPPSGGPPTVHQQFGHQHSSGSFSALPDASRLHVVFGKPLPEQDVQRAFDAAAPGLQYVSRHGDKPFAFVKYASTASAMVAMVRMHNSVLCGQRLRVTLADPPPSSAATASGSQDFSTRKRQRDVNAGLKPNNSASPNHPSGTSVTPADDHEEEEELGDNVQENGATEQTSLDET